MQPIKRIPLTVIGGFLGAGKTTLLNRLLTQAQGCRLAVLVNDFGAINIDAGLIAARGADAIALSNGCVCCSIGDDLSAALMRVLDAEPAFDAIVIEASGVSDPWRIAQVGIADPGLALGGVVVLVDASAVLEQATDPLLADSVQRQLRAADWILINKTDLVDREQVMRVQAWTDRCAPGVACFATRQAALPAVLAAALFGRADVVAAAPPLDRIGRQRGSNGCDEHVHGHAVHDDGHHGGHDDHSHGAGASGADGGACIDHAAQFESASWQPQGVLSAAVLRALLRDMPAGVLRLKGLVRTDVHGWAELQFAGRHGSLRRALPGQDAVAAVVAIGVRGRLPRTALARAFGQD